jgi:hypothetical protein
MGTSRSTSQLVREQSQDGSSPLFFALLCWCSAIAHRLAVNDRSNCNACAIALILHNSMSFFGYILVALSDKDLAERTAYIEFRICDRPFCGLRTPAIAELLNSCFYKLISSDPFKDVQFNVQNVLH